MSDRPRRLVFGEVAEAYEANRPSYPEALIDDLAAWAGSGGALEVGAGTGLATRLLAARGVDVLAIEPSAEMAAIARSATAGLLGAVEVVESDFESLPEPDPPTRRFSLVYAAQAWHWVDPDRGYVRARAALGDGGRLVAFWNRAAWRRSPMRATLSEVYARVAPELEVRGAMHPDAEYGTAAEEQFWRTAVARAAGFDDPRIDYYDWEAQYTADGYAALITTFSALRLMEPEDRERLAGAVRGVIEDAGGTLAVPMTVQVASAIAV